MHDSRPLPAGGNRLRIQPVAIVGFGSIQVIQPPIIRPVKGFVGSLF
jgi:hypothetical protein